MIYIRARTIVSCTIVLRSKMKNRKSKLPFVLNCMEIVQSGENCLKFRDKIVPNVITPDCRNSVSPLASGSPPGCALPTCTVLLIVRMNPLSRLRRHGYRRGILNETVTRLLQIDLSALEYVAIIPHSSHSLIDPRGASA